MDIYFKMTSVKKFIALLIQITLFMCSPMYRSTGIFCAAEGEKGSLLFLGSKYLKKILFYFFKNPRDVKNSQDKNGI